MADTSNIKIAVEKAIHDGLRNAIQMIADEYGIFVDEISVQWIDTGAVSGGQRTGAIATLSERSHS